MQYPQSGGNRLHSWSSLEIRSEQVGSSFPGLNHIIGEGITFLNALRRIEAAECKGREELIDKARVLFDSSKAFERAVYLLKISPEQQIEQIMQRLTGGFFVQDRFIAFADRIGMREHAPLNFERGSFVNQMFEITPIGAAVLASYWASQDEMKSHCPALEMAVEAAKEIGAFFVWIEQRIPTSRDNMRMLAAWKTDLIRPVIEATVYALSVALMKDEGGVPAGATWFAPLFPVSAQRVRSHPFITELRDYGNNQAVVGRLLKYYGFDLRDSSSKGEMLKEEALPVPMLIGANDAGIYLRWMRDSFKRANGALSHGVPITVNKSPRGNFEFGRDLRLYVRAKEGRGHQPSIGLEIGGEKGEFSLRLEKDEHRLMLSYSAITALDFIGYARDVHRENRRHIELYGRLRKELSSASPSSRVQKELAEQSEKISIFGRDKVRIQRLPSTERLDLNPKQAALFAIAISGLGRLIGSRVNESLGNQISESLAQISTSTFASFNQDLINIFER